MTEPATATGAILSIKYGYIIAGAIGGVVALRHIEGLSTFGRVIAVLSGAIVASYGTPAIDSLFSLNNEVESGVAFLLGLTAMNIIPGLIRVSEMFKSDPLAFIRRIKNERDGDGHG